jgi:hypothetical protein
LRWRRELNSLGKQIGIMTSDEIKSETFRLSNVIGEKPERKKYCFAPTELPKTSGFQRSISNLMMDATGETTKKNPEELTTRIKTGRFNESRTRQTSSKAYLNHRIYSSANKYIMCNIFKYL